MNVPTDLLRRLLERYREQTVAVGGLRAGERFDADPDITAIRRRIEDIRRSGSRREPARRSK